MAAALFGDVQSLRMAIQAEILALSPGSAFSNWFLLSLVCGSWHLMQSRTAGGCTVPFRVGGIFLRVATQTERLGRRGDQLDPGDVFVDPNFVTAQTSRRDGRVDRFAFRLILMALKALGRVDVLVERHGMLFGKCRNYLNRYKENCELEEAGEGLTNFEFNAHTETK